MCVELKIQRPFAMDKSTERIYFFVSRLGESKQTFLYVYRYFETFMMARS